MIPKRTALQVTILKDDAVFLKAQGFSMFSILNLTYCVSCPGCTNDKSMVEDFLAGKYQSTAVFHENTMPIETYEYTEVQDVYWASATTMIVSTVVVLAVALVIIFKQ